MPMTDEKFC